MDKMIKDAETFLIEDKKLEKTNTAKNDLESCAYSLKHQISDKGQLNEKLSKDDKKVIQEAVESTIGWIESNPNANTDDFVYVKSQLEKIVKPITYKLYQGKKGFKPKDRVELW